jgi:glucose/arabinose dehydrogenase
MSRVSCLFSTVLVCFQLAFSQPIQLVNAFPNLTFTTPVFLTHSGDGTDRIFVAQQNGIIRVFPNDTLVAASTTFLNIANKISSPSGEEGLLGLAFHPQYATNGYFYVNYTAPNPLRTVISRFKVSAGDPDRADSLSEYKILEFNQPYSNHNGGMVAFGVDGDLYIGAGDGGSGGDPQNNAQNLSVLLGKILRIDVDDTTLARRYRIPSDNPWAGNLAGYREEIWAYGLRNPWRFSFDPPTGQLWAGDVGQNAHEEIDLVGKGMNYGWRIMEGSYCYNPSSGCDQTNLTLPIKDYGRTLGYSVTGGYVYRGSRRPELQEAYVYGDYGSGRIWMLRYNGIALTADSLLIQAPFNISSFGTDQKNELYVLSYSTGGIFRFNRAAVTDSKGSESDRTPTEFRLEQNFPNPFNPTTEIRYNIAGGRGWGQGASFVRLVVYDLLGREVAVLVNEQQASGSYLVKFDAAGLASGVYVFRLTADGPSATRKMVVAR